MPVICRSCAVEPTFGGKSKMASNESYHKQVAKKNELKLRELRSSLPSFCDRFFRGIEPTTASRTRIAYAIDLKVFFNYVQTQIDIHPI